MPVSLDDLRQALEDAFLAEDVADVEDLDEKEVKSIVESFEANARAAFQFSDDDDEEGESAEV